MADVEQTPATCLTKDEISRYSRQLILPEIGVQGQIRMKNSSVLIVGAGGLGCPVAAYLAAAGIGHLGIIDYDQVEISNLHRQILHTEDVVGLAKSESIAQAVKRLNSTVKCTTYEEQISSKNALDIFSKYDVVVDATDNAPTRYLLNDACVLSKKPLVSGSALRFEGMLTVFNYNNGPCYRCLYPTPPPPDLVTNCSDGGVLGAVPGVIGTLQAIEVVKLVVGLDVSYSSQMLIFDGLRGNFRQIKLRPKQSTCVVCSKTPEITQLIDYEQFCCSSATDKTKNVTLLTSEERISCKDYQKLVDRRDPHFLIDVREPFELEICKLPDCYNIPYTKFDKQEHMQSLINEIEKLPNHDKIQVIVVCRRGNDSQLAVRSLQNKLLGMNVSIRDIQGGLHEWAATVDPDFPLY